MVNVLQLTQLGVLSKWLNLTVTTSMILVCTPDMSSRFRIQVGTSTLLNITEMIKRLI